jgi:delta 1-pyrroline-5-carboxylate dehydrogenase
MMSVRRWLTAGATALAVVVGVAWVITAATGSSLWPFGPSRPHEAGPQARVYLNATACLLTNPGGIAPGTAGAPAWRAMQAASLSTHVMVSYLPDTGPADAGVMLSTLAERHCGVVITTGTSAAKVIKAARAQRQQRFVLVAASGPAAPAGPPNAVIVSPAGAPARIDQAIRALAAQAQAPRS